MLRIPIIVDIPRLRRFACLRYVAATLVVALIPLYAAAEIDRNWYIKTRFGSDSSSGVRFSDRDCSSETPAALYGCGTGGDGHPYRSAGNADEAPNVELGIGRQVSPRLRMEAMLGHHLQRTFRGHTNFLDPSQMQSVEADLSSLSLVFAVKVDFKTVVVPGNVRLVPHIGLGIGAIQTKISEMKMTFPRTSTTVPGGVRSDFAWSAATGVGIELTPRTILEFDLRYSDLGEVRTARGPGLVVWRDGSRPPLPLDLEPTRARLRSSGLGMSVRFKL